jgi:hypothetical protein
MIIRLRTRDSLTQLLALGKSPAWKVGEDKESQITKVQIFNWDCTQVLEADFDADSSNRRNGDNRLVVGFHRLGAIIRVVEPAYLWSGRNPVNYSKS